MILLLGAAPPLFGRARGLSFWRVGFLPALSRPGTSSVSGSVRPPVDDSGIPRPERRRR
ncbi:hypothetical protein ACFPRL_08185 [Pseudoclavibacter helvolus]